MLFPIFIPTDFDGFSFFEPPSGKTILKWLLGVIAFFALLFLCVLYFSGTLTYHTDRCKVDYINHEGKIVTTKTFEYNIVDGKGFITFDKDNIFELTDLEKTIINHSIYSIITGNNDYGNYKNVSAKYFPVKMSKGEVFFNGVKATKKKKNHELEFEIRYLVEKVVDAVGITKETLETESINYMDSKGKNVCVYEFEYIISGNKPILLINGEKIFLDSETSKNINIYLSAAITRRYVYNIGSFPENKTVKFSYGKILIDGKKVDTLDDFYRKKIVGLAQSILVQ